MRVKRLVRRTVIIITPIILLLGLVLISQGFEDAKRIHQRRVVEAAVGPDIMEFMKSQEANEAYLRWKSNK